MSTGDGEAISTAGAWPGDGGYVYISTDQGASGGPGKLDVYKFMPTTKGVPALRLVGVSSQNTVFGTSGPLITSDGTTSGSAVVWIIDAATLQAYDAGPSARRADAPRILVHRQHKPLQSARNRAEHGLCRKPGGHPLWLRQEGIAVAGCRISPPSPRHSGCHNTCVQSNSIGLQDDDPYILTAHALGEVCDSEGVPGAA